MDQIFALMKQTLNCHLTDNQGNRIGDAPLELVDLFSNEEAASRAKLTAEQESRKNVKLLGCDREIFTIQTRWLRHTPFD